MLRQCLNFFPQAEILYILLNCCSHSGLMYNLYTYRWCQHYIEMFSFWARSLRTFLFRNSIVCRKILINKFMGYSRVPGFYRRKYKETLCMYVQKYIPICIQIQRVLLKLVLKKFVIFLLL